MLGQRECQDLLDQGFAKNFKKEYTKASIKFCRAIRISPNNGSANYNLGNTQFLQGKFDNAVVTYQSLTNIDPKNEQAYYNLGVTLFQQKKYEDAIEQYGKAAEINPYITAAYGNWGYTLYFLGRYEEALDILKKAIALRDGRVLPYLNSGLVLFHQGKFGEAIEMMREGIKIGIRNIRDFKNTISHYKNENKSAEQQRQLNLNDRKLKDHLETKKKAIRLLFGLIKNDYPNKYQQFDIEFEIDDSLVKLYSSLQTMTGIQEILLDSSLKEYFFSVLQGLKTAFSKILETNTTKKNLIASSISSHLLSIQIPSNVEMDVEKQQASQNFNNSSEIEDLILTLAEKLTLSRKDFILNNCVEKIDLKQLEKIEEIKQIIEMNNTDTKIEECALIDAYVAAAACLIEGQSSNVNHKTDELLKTILTNRT